MDGFQPLENDRKYSSNPWKNHWGVVRSGRDVHMEIRVFEPRFHEVNISVMRKLEQALGFLVGNGADRFRQLGEDPIHGAFLGNVPGSIGPNHRVGIR